MPGQPLTRSASLDPQLLETLLPTMSRYIGFRAHAFAVPGPAAFDELARMIQFNLAGFDIPSLPAPPENADRACIVDGRMLPHEWIATPAGYLKTDALDHGDNHFYPGPCDPAWDLAGAIAEFDFHEEAREVLVDAYERASGDGGVRARLPFFTAAYLAFRIGYASMNQLTGQAGYYRALLHREATAAA